MEHRCLRIFLLLAVLDSTAFIAASGNQTVLARVIKEGVNNPLFELRYHDLPSVLQSLQLFATPAEKEENEDNPGIEDEAMYLANKSSLLSKREVTHVNWKFSETENVSETEVETNSPENDSCETTASNYGHRHKVGTMVHEYFCELNKVVRYIASIAQDLKLGSPLVVALNITEDVFSFTEIALDGDLSQLIETVVIRFEEFLKHPENLKTLITISKKFLRVATPILKSVIKLTNSIKKFANYVKHLFAYFQVDFKHILKKIENNIVIFGKKALSLFYGYVLNPAEEIADLFFEAVTWMETTADNLISYIRRKLYRYLAFFEEGIDILQAFFSGFSASGFSQTFIEILQLFGMSEKVTTSEDSSTNVMMNESSSQSITSELVLDE